MCKYVLFCGIFLSSKDHDPNYLCLERYAFVNEVIADNCKNLAW